MVSRELVEVRRRRRLSRVSGGQEGRDVVGSKGRVHQRVRRLVGMMGCSGKTPTRARSQDPKTVRQLPLFKSTTGTHLLGQGGGRARPPCESGLLGSPRAAASTTSRSSVAHPRRFEYEQAHQSVDIFPRTLPSPTGDRLVPPPLLASSARAASARDEPKQHTSIFRTEAAYHYDCGGKIVSSSLSPCCCCCWHCVSYAFQQSHGSAFRIIPANTQSNDSGPTAHHAPPSFDAHLLSSSRIGAFPLAP